jgi:hypothetical protein
MLFVIVISYVVFVLPSVLFVAAAIDETLSD